MLFVCFNGNNNYYNEYLQRHQWMARGFVSIKRLQRFCWLMDSNIYSENLLFVHDNDIISIFKLSE